MCKTMFEKKKKQKQKPSGYINLANKILWKRCRQILSCLQNLVDSTQLDSIALNCKMKND
jgi:hypothetical protein